MGRKITAIIVAYNSSRDGLWQVLRAVQSQVEHIVLVDNSDADTVRGWLQEWAIQNVEYHFAGGNIGIGAAQNIGIARAAQMGASHVLLLDDDSVPEPDMVWQLSEAAERLTRSGINLAAVGPRFRLHGTGVLSGFHQFGRVRFKPVRCEPGKQQETIPADILISSGCLIPIEAMNDIGHMDGSLFIDLVDTEWILRAGAKGYRSFGVCDAIMNHALGDSVRRVWLGKMRDVTVHSPLRTYYMVRNSVLVSRRAYVSWGWVINHVLNLLPTFVALPLYISPRGQYLLMMLRGFRDGLLGRTGGYRR